MKAREIGKALGPVNASALPLPVGPLSD